MEDNQTEVHQPYSEGLNRPSKVSLWLDKNLLCMIIMGQIRNVHILRTAATIAVANFCLFVSISVSILN
jgi:hypothetical protein